MVRSTSSSADASALPKLLGAAGPPQCELELRAQERERRPELMARIRDEATLARETGLEPAEHRVERLTEAPDLVSCGRERQPLAGTIARHLLGPATHRLDRPQRSTGDEVAGERGEEECERTCHEQLCQKLGERFLAILEGGADDEHECIVDRRDEKSRRLAVERSQRGAVENEARPLRRVRLPPR